MLVVSGLSLIAPSPCYPGKFSVMTLFFKIMKLLPGLFACMVGSKMSSIYSWDSMLLFAQMGRNDITSDVSHITDLHACRILLGKRSSPKNV